MYALVSVVLVVGGLSLALAEGGFNTRTATATVQATFTSVVPSPSLTAGPSATEAADTSTPSVATPTTAAPSATFQSLPFTVTALPPSATLIYSTPLPTYTKAAYHTSVACGPYHGWVLSYYVQPGDTLYHIATQYQTTVTALQVANCKPTTVIFPGERLWVPNVPTITPGVTLVPIFPTSTPVPTEPLTLTPLPIPTDTAVPTSTAIPNP